MKTDGIASATSALRYWELRQEVMANNLANASTDGFRGERVFARLLEGQLPVAESATDTREGTFRPTGNPLDVAVRGDAFFVLQTPDGERWTRGGAWRVNDASQLTDVNGNPLLGANGPIEITGGATVTIDRAGTVRANGVEVDRLRLERSTVGSLQHEGEGRYLPPDDRTAIEPEQRQVHQGVLEDSNVNTVSSLVDMISITRNYAFAQKILTTLDGIRSTIANDIAKPA
jgi:flagellar basal-body rod protein FlgG